MKVLYMVINAGLDNLFCKESPIVLFYLERYLNDCRRLI